MVGRQVWVIHNGADWEFSELLAAIAEPTVFHLLKEAVKTFQLPENDAYVQLQFNEQTISNRKLLSSLPDDGSGILEFNLVHLTPKCSPNELQPTKFLSPLDFRGKPESSFNEEAMMSEIIYLEGEHLLLNNLVFNEHRQNASVSEYVPVIGSLGNTGTGKSLIMASLLGKDGRLPTVRSSDQTESTTANCNLFYAKDTYQMFLDFEGECGTDPSGLRAPIKKFIKRRIEIPKKKVYEKKEKKTREFILEKKEKKLREQQKEEKKREPAEARKRADISDKRPDSFATEDLKDEGIKRLTRREVVAKLLPKLAYIICDVILFVTTDEIHADFSVYDRCMTFAMRANAFVQDADRPALVIIHNKYNVSLNNLDRELDINASTKTFLETFDPDLKLAGYFSVINVVRLPMIGDAYDNAMLRKLWDQQIERLHMVIQTTRNNRSQHRITMSCQLTHKLWYRFVEVIVEDMVYDKPISAAKHLQQIIHMEFEEHIQPLIDLFHKVYKRKKRTVNWFYQCARFSVDTLARLWGISLRDGGYDIEQNHSYGKKILTHLMDYLDSMKPCTATHPAEFKVQCNQTKSLHVCHRSSMHDQIRSRYRKIVQWITQRGLTITWEGQHQFADDEIERDADLCESFWKTAKCFARNDLLGIQEAMSLVLEHPDYRSCIWETLLLGAWDSDQELRSWAKRLVVDSMRLLDVEHTDNIWDKAVSDWEYLNVLCKQISIESIVLKDVIGRGSFGCVYEGIYTLHKEHHRCAVKVIQSDIHGFDLNILRQEIAVMSLIEDKSLLRLFGYCQFPGPSKNVTSFYLVTELMEFSLQHWLNEKKCFSVEDLLLIAGQVAEGIQTLHNHNIIHRDIKPANILLRNLGSTYQVVLADMGLARLVTNGNMSVGVGTCGFMAPEVCEKGEGGYDHKADVYSFGRVLEKMVDLLDNSFEEETRELMMNLVKLCCARKPSKRTNIIYVLYRLKEMSYSDTTTSELFNLSRQIDIQPPTELMEDLEALEPKKRKRSKLFRKRNSAGAISPLERVPGSLVSSTNLPMIIKSKKKSGKKRKKEKSKTLSGETIPSVVTKTKDKKSHKS